MMVRKSVAVVTVTVGLLAAAAAPAAARPPGPPQIPALVGAVQDSCTRLALPAVQVTLRDEVTGALLAPTKLKGAHFTFDALPAGDYRLLVSSPGYQDLANDDGPGVDLIKPPSPNAPGAEFTAGLVAKLRLDPITPSGTCRPPGPPNVPGLVAVVRDLNTHTAVAGLTVNVFDPATGAQPPGPPIKIGTGRFVQKVLPEGTWAVDLAAAGYQGFTGATVIQPPGPPTRVGTIAVGLKLGIGLTPGP